MYQNEFAVTDHAAQRMSRRHISTEAIAAVLDYGRMVYTRGAVVYGLGRKEVLFYAEQGIDLSEFEGVQVVAATFDEMILTVYRNRSFRGLRAGLGRGRRRNWRRHDYN